MKSPRGAQKAKKLPLTDSITFQIGDLFFSWDKRKSRVNFKNHGVAFQEAATYWRDEYAVETYDEKHSDTEIRWLMIGKSDVGRILTCWYTQRRFGEQEVIRLIGARRSLSSEIWELTVRADRLRVPRC